MTLHFLVSISQSMQSRASFRFMGSSQFTTPGALASIRFSDVHVDESLLIPSQTFIWLKLSFLTESGFLFILADSRDTSYCVVNLCHSVCSFTFYWYPKPSRNCSIESALIQILTDLFVLPDSAHWLQPLSQILSDFPIHGSTYESYWVC